MILKPNQQFFKIRDNETGLYSEGGVWPRFSKFGKTWTSRGALKSHLTMLGYYAKYASYSSHHRDRGYGSPPQPRYVVVAYNVSVVEAGSWSVAYESERPAKK